MSAPPRLRAALRGAAAVVGAVSLAFSGLVLSDAGTREAVRRHVSRLDDAVLGGALHDLRAGGRRGDRSVLPPHDPDAYAWLTAGAFVAVAHGLGPVLTHGQDAMATLDEGVALGFSVFEVDLALTSDGHLVCYHGEDDEDLASLRYEAYRDTVRARGLTPCESGDLVAAARRYPHVVFVLDPKNRVTETYRLLRRQIASRELGRRFVPQIYAPDEAAEVRQGGFFAGEIFTAYRSRLSTRTILDWARRADVGAVTLTLERAQSLEGLPARPAVLVHPVDVPSIAVALRAAGARGIYTHYLSPRLAPALYATWTATCRPPRVWDCGTRPTGPRREPAPAR